MRQVHGFQVGEVLRAAVVVYGRNWRILVPLTLLTHLPLFLLSVLYPQPEPPAMPAPPQNPEESRRFFSEMMAALMEFYESIAGYWVMWELCSAWMQAVGAYVVVRALRSSAPTLGQALWQSVQALPRVVVVGLLAGLAVFCAMLLFVVPGIIVMLMLWVAIPAAVIERRYGSALRRSYNLTLGHKVPILGIVILFVVFQFACGLVSAALVADFVPQLSSVASAIVTAAVASVGAVVIGVCYHDLRAHKEGASSNTVAKVFE